MTLQREVRTTAAPESLVGVCRRFGPTGPLYQVIAPGSPAGPDDPTMRIRVVETGEEIDYRLAEILDDPED